MKLNIVDTKSKVLFKTAITFVNDNDTIVDFFKSKKINQDDVIQSRCKSRLFGLHVFFAFFRKKIFDKFAAAMSCT